MNYIEHLLILISTVTGCVFVSASASLVGIPIETTSAATGKKIYVIILGIKNYNSIIKKKKKKHDQILLLAQSKLNIGDFLISKALIGSNICDNEFVFKNNVPK